MGTRRRFSAEFKRDAASQVIDQDATIKQIASELGLVEQTLGKWVGAERERRMSEATGLPTSRDVNAWMVRLRRENARLRMENEFLGKASALLAREACQRERFELMDA